ncbi:hypothetical protein [Bacillus cereus]|uniref:Uncharacterized protein n=1 Tax=Bacillus cereus TaxID=1396 RepID=A0A164QC13_BACCE|nr:hypothetical protein [Bacillus cereus]KZD70939.1 hypothetical protein B4088_0995 [Bacillus cereus]
MKLKLMVGILSAGLFLSLFGNVFQWLYTDDLQKKQVGKSKQEEVMRKDALPSDTKTEEAIQKSAKQFLEALFTYDSSKKSPMEQIKGYSSPEAQKKLKPAGQGSEASKVSLVSQLEDVQLYSDAKGKVFAKVKQSISVNGGDRVRREQYVEMTLINKNNWIVDDVKLLALMNQD